MTVHRVVWKASPSLTLEPGVHGIQYVFDDESHEVMEQEVVDYEDNIRSVLHQETLLPEQIPASVQQSLWGLGFWGASFASHPSRPD